MTKLSTTKLRSVPEMPDLFHPRYLRFSRGYKVNVNARWIFAWTPWHAWMTSFGRSMIHDSFFSGSDDGKAICIKVSHMQDDIYDFGCQMFEMFHEA